MAKYLVSTTEDQEAILTWLTATYNREHDSTFSNSEFIELRFPQLLSPYEGPYNAAVLQQLEAQFTSADPSTQAQVKGLLNVGL